MENIELRTDINIMESMMQVNIPGTIAASGVTGDNTVMENIELGTEQNIYIGNHDGRYSKSQLGKGSHV